MPFIRRQGADHLRKIEKAGEEAIAGGGAISAVVLPYASKFPEQLLK